MNYKPDYRNRLESLRQTFLTSTTQPLLYLACCEGGAILIHAQENGAIHYNESAKDIIPGTKFSNHGNEPIQAMYFRVFASLESRDQTFANAVKRTNDITILSRRYASFCLELIDMLQETKPVNIVATVERLFSDCTGSHAEKGQEMASLLTDDEWEEYKKLRPGIRETTTIENHFAQRSKDATKKPK